ncbi:MAG TPA: RodZ domain-containing protein [Rhodocyclaceae bacterium]|nr:RodZ domain-containing protein [Rhodocyclaceae bacterium]
MSDENRDVESGEAGASSMPSVGSQLKAAREGKQMSVGDIAMALKLGSRQVEALENGDWHSLPGQTFIRGFVRNYARLLQIDPAPFMVQLDSVLETPKLRLTLPEQKHQVAMPQSGRPRRRDYAMALSGVGLVAIAAAIYFLWPVDLSGVREGIDTVASLFSRHEPEPAPAAPAAAPQAEPVFPPGTTPQQVMNPQAVNPAEAGNSATATTAGISSPALVPPSVTQAPEPQKTADIPAPAQDSSVPAASAKAGGLRLTFAQDSWVEVRDGQGRIIFSHVGRAGSEQDVEGLGPFSLIVGNAPGVKVSLRGKPVELAPYTQGNVARLKLD